MVLGNILFCKDLGVLLYAKCCFHVIVNSYLVLKRCSWQDHSTPNPRLGNARLEVLRLNGASPTVPLSPLESLIHMTIYWGCAFSPPFIRTVSATLEPPASSSALLHYDLLPNHHPSKASSEAWPVEEKQNQTKPSHRHLGRGYCNTHATEGHIEVLFWYFLTLESLTYRNWCVPLLQSQQQKLWQHLW